MMNTLTAAVIQLQATVIRADEDGNVTPLPQEVRDGLATITFWIQAIGASLAIIALMILGIGMWFAQRNETGDVFMSKAGKWLAGALIFGLAAAIAPVFIGMGG